MDRWKFFDVTQRDHVICNPLSLEKLDELIALLDLPEGARALDIASGKAELLIRLAERHAVNGDGVDLSPYFLAEGRRRAEERGVTERLNFHEQDGAAFAATPGSYDAAICLGASWIWGGYRGTLRALRRFARPGGLVVSGEPYWRREPEPAYLAASGLDPGLFATHAGNVAIGVEEGLTPLYTLVSSEDDWDRYEGLQWRAAARYAAQHPEDEDAAEIARRQGEHRDSYLRWGRETLGWAVYLFRRDGGTDATTDRTSVDTARSTAPDG
jgi:SAM-dependent methyltransferase